MSKKANDCAYAAIEKGCIVIRLNTKSLPMAVSGACDLMTIEGDWQVTNVAKFAREVVRELNEEDEDGTTLIHEMFDAAFNQVIEQGGEGISPVEDIDE